jgi:PhnB protein
MGPPGPRTDTLEALMAIVVEPALSPHLTVDDAAAAIDFYVKAFGAVEVGRVPRPDGKLVHAAVRINGFLVMLNDDFPEMSGGKSMTPPALGGTPVTIHLTVTDVDADFQRALDAGAKVIVPLDEQFWGDRYGMVADPFGHHWSLGQPIREVSHEEIAAAMNG